MKKLLIIPLFALSSCANMKYKECIVVYQYENGDRYESSIHTSATEARKLHKSKEYVTGYDKAGNVIEGYKTYDCK